MITNEQSIIERAKHLYYVTRFADNKTCLHQAINELADKKELNSLYQMFDMTLNDIENYLLDIYFVGDNYSEN